MPGSCFRSDELVRQAGTRLFPGNGKKGHHHWLQESRTRGTGGGALHHHQMLHSGACEFKKGDLLRNKSLQPSWLSFSKRVSTLDTKKGCGGCCSSILPEAAPRHHLGDHTGVISILSGWRSCIGATKGLCHVFFGPKRPPAEGAGRELSWSVHFRFRDGIPISLGQAGLAKLFSSRAFPCPQLLGQMST